MSQALGTVGSWCFLQGTGALWSKVGGCHRWYAAGRCRFQSCTVLPFNAQPSCFRIAELFTYFLKYPVLLVSCACHTTSELKFPSCQHLGAISEKTRLLSPYSHVCGTFGDWSDWSNWSWKERRCPWSSTRARSLFLGNCGYNAQRLRWRWKCGVTLCLSIIRMAICSCSSGSWGTHGLYPLDYGLSPAVSG